MRQLRGVWHERGVPLIGTRPGWRARWAQLWGIREIPKRAPASSASCPASLALHNAAYIAHALPAPAPYPQGVCMLHYKGPLPIGYGLRAAVRDKFPDIVEVRPLLRRLVCPTVPW